MNELGSISESLQNEPESLRKSIISGMAKLKGLDLLTAANAFQRDQVRLNERQRAYYRKMGLDVPERTEDDDTIHNILADNITINDGDERKQSVNGNTKTTSPRLAAALAVGSVLAGAGGMAAYNALNKPPEVAQPAPDESIYELHLLD